MDCSELLLEPQEQLAVQSLRRRLNTRSSFEKILLLFFDTRRSRQRSLSHQRHFISRCLSRKVTAMQDKFALRLKLPRLHQGLPFIVCVLYCTFDANLVGTQQMLHSLFFAYCWPYHYHAHVRLPFSSCLSAEAKGLGLGRLDGKTNYPPPQATPCSAGFRFLFPCPRSVTAHIRETNAYSSNCS